MTMRSRQSKRTGPPALLSRLCRRWPETSTARLLDRRLSEAFRQPQTAPFASRHLSGLRRRRPSYDGALTADGGGDPASLVGYGVPDPSAARRGCAGSGRSRFLSDGDGQVRCIDWLAEGCCSSGASLALFGHANHRRLFFSRGGSAADAAGVGRALAPTAALPNAELPPSQSSSTLLADRIRRMIICCDIGMVNA